MSNLIINNNHLIEQENTHDEEEVLFQRRYKKLIPETVLDIDAAGIVPIADDETFVLIVDSDHSYISCYGRCAVRTACGYELISEEPCQTYTILIERVVGNRPLFVEETIQTEQLVVEAFIVNQDAAYSNIIFHLDNDSYDFYYRDLFPVNDAQFAELLRLKEQGQAISEEIVMGVVNDTRWWPPWFKARYYMPSVQGVGYLGCPDADITSPSYIRWSNMVARCYSENRQKRFPGYKGVQVADEWKNYATYRKWHDSHFYQVEGEKMDVDHDISIPGSKLYGPCTAAFVPHSVNMVVCYLKSNHPEGMPIGVYQDKKGLFYVVASFLGERWTSENHYKYLGEATNAYKRIKEKAIALKAEQYKNFLPRTVYDSLICWVVDTKYIKKKISAG